MAWLRKKPPQSAYYRLRSCDCPDCRPRSAILRLLAWLDSPAGPWATLLLVLFCLGLAAVYWYFRPAADLAATAVRG